MIHDRSSRKPVSAVHQLDSVLAGTRSAMARYSLLSAEQGWVSVLPEPQRSGSTQVALVDRGTVIVSSATLGDLQLDEGDVLFASAGPAYTLTGDPGARLHSLSLQVEALTAEPLAGVLPQLLKLDRSTEMASSMAAVIALIVREHAENRPGTDVITSRLADVVYVSAVRAAAECFADGTWLALLHDDRLGRAVAAAHDDLGHPWTVAELARVAGMSRSAFAAAFRAASGQGPLEHLTWWRVHRAKCLLRTTDLGLTQIGARLGFSSGTALSRVFRRHTGVSPMHWRQSALESSEVRMDAESLT